MAEGKLQEVEEDAMYIASKRFREHYEEQDRLKEQKARAEAKANNAEKVNSEKDK